MAPPADAGLRDWVAKFMSVAMPVASVVVCCRRTTGAPVTFHELLVSIGCIATAGVATNIVTYTFAGEQGRHGGPPGYKYWSVWISANFQAIVFPGLLLWRIAALGGPLAFMAQPASHATQLDLVPHAVMAGYMLKDLVMPWTISRIVFIHHVFCLLCALGMASSSLRWGHNSFFAGVVILEMGSLANNVQVLNPSSRFLSAVSVHVMKLSNAVSVAILLHFLLIGDGWRAAIDDTSAMLAARWGLTIVNLPLVYLRGESCAASRREALARFAKEQ